MPFLDSLRDVLGGFADVKQIDKEGFDFREKRRQDELARQQQQQQWEQANQDYAVKAGSEAAVGGMGEQDLGSLLPAQLSNEQRKAAIARMIGGAAQQKSSLEDQKTYRDLTRQGMQGQQRREEIGLRGDEAQELATLRSKLAANQPISPYQEARLKQLEAFEQGREGRFERGQRGINERWGNMPTQVFSGKYDKYGNPIYDYKPRAEVVGGAFPRPNLPEQRERVGGEVARESMQTNLDTIQRQLNEVKKYAGVGAFGSPVDAYNARTVYKSTVQNLAIAANRVLGDTSGRYSDVDRQVAANMLGVANDVLLIADPELAQKRLDEARQTIGAMGKVQQRLRPAAPRGADSGEVTIRSREEAAALPTGATFMFNGKKLRKVGPGQYEAVP